MNIQIYRLRATEKVGDLPASEVVTAVDQMLEVAKESDGPYPGEGVWELAAEVLSKRHLAPQRLVQIAEERLAAPDIQSKGPTSDLYATPENIAHDNFYENRVRTQFLKFKTEGYLGLNEAAKAHVTLQQFGKSLHDQEALVGENQGWHRMYLNGRSAYWELMAQLAELEGHKQDAMAYYERALLTRLEAKQETMAGEKNEVTDSAHKLWTSLGGTEASWDTWYAERAAGFSSVSNQNWQNAKEPLPPFRLIDLNDKTWTLSNLEGRVTLVTVWAT